MLIFKYIIAGVYHLKKTDHNFVVTEPDNLST